MKVGVTIFVLFAAFMIIGSSVSIYTFYLDSKDILTKKAHNHLQTTADSRAAHVNSFLEEHKHMVELLTPLVNCNELDVIVETHIEFYEVFILNNSGKVVCSSSEENVGLDKSQNEYFIEGKKGTFIKNAYPSNTTGKDSIAISSPIPNGGVFVVRMETIELDNITLSEIGLGETGEIYLINKYGYMITPSRFWPEELTFLKHRVDTKNSRKCLSMNTTEHIGHEPIEVFLDYRGKKVLGTHVPILEMEWCLLAEIDEREVLGQLNIQLIKSAMISLIIMTFFILLAVYIIKRITKQIYLRGS